ncbi:transporter substrate-binding domain-containing protein [Streptomyces sp. NBC_01016]|uniref:transporter substrate-binding domain-containing protein n=1 Tax=Streptomyces sp. NBC_01016 TaxID=2903720 RepID=UPI00225ABB71|nr:transporter substrate-binding domain-containing protein [Streptomyces sp. NBC_01016]MCX4830010.1 transporter substrate-binding domain-containing protein [Streptomyces sp. NBC_01016]
MSEKQQTTDASGSIFKTKGNMVTIAVKKGQPGFSTRRGDEYSYEGFENDLVHSLSEDMGFSPDPRDIPSLDRERILTNDGAELVVATYTITKSRDKKVDFTVPYLKTYQSVLVRKDNTTINRLKDLDNPSVRICTAGNSTSDPKSTDDKKEQERIEVALGKRANVEYRADYKTCVRQLQDDNFDAVWTDRVLLEGFAQAAPYAKDVEVRRKIQTPGPAQFYGIAINENHQADCKKLNKAIRHFLHTDWTSTFRSQFPGLTHSGVNPQEFKPSDRDIRDKEPTSCGRGPADKGA